MPDTRPLLKAAVAPARIAWLDLLRGIAVAGMLLVHVANAAHGSGDAYERWSSALDFLAKGKFYTIFALLFGISFALQGEKTQEGRASTELFWRRLGGLALIMLALQVLFGASLFYYAFWGVPLLLLRRMSTRWLVAAIVVFASLQPLTIVAEGLYRVSVAGPEAAAAGLELRQVERRELARATAAQTSYSERLRSRASQFQLNRALTMANIIRFEWGAFALAVFIVGLLAVRHKVLQEPGAHRVMLLRIAMGCTALAIAGLALDKVWDPGFAYPAFNAVARQGLGLLRTEWLGIAYAVGLSLVLARYAHLSILRPLAAVGRAALSNYALHLFIMEALFARWALGISLDWRLAIPVATVVFGLQAAVTTWWLRRHQQGPLEQFWRSVTYGRLEARRTRSAW